MKKRFNIGKFCDKAKHCLFADPLLSFRNKKNITSYILDNQFLHFYPLNIKVYYEAYQNGKKIKYDVDDVKKQDLKKILYYLAKMNKNDIFLLEIKISNDINFDVHELNEFLQQVKKYNCLITLKVSCLNFEYSHLNLNNIETIKYVFPKLTLKTDEIKAIKFFAKNKLKKHCYIAKIYMELAELSKYRKIIRELKNNNFDYVIISKKLIPLELKENPLLLTDFVFGLKSIQLEYETEKFKIKVVNELLHLYYDRFQIENENFRNCVQCRLSTYYLDGKNYPCSSYQIVHNKITYNSLKNDGYVDDYIASKCKDCAYIYENDYINKLISQRANKLKFYDNLKSIHPIGVGTFKINNVENVRNNILLGQNLIDCNLAYKKGITFNKLSKVLQKFDREKLNYYIKLYRKINTIEDIKQQLIQYMYRLKTDYVDIVTIHSLDIIDGMSLLEIYKCLQKLKKQKIIRHIGCCNISLEQLKGLISNGIDIEFFEGPYNFLNQYYEICGLIDFCRENNITYIAYQSLYMIDKLKDGMRHLLIKYKCNIEQLLINYYVKYKKFLLLIKSESKEHIRRNMNSLFYISFEDFDQIDNIIKSYCNYENKVDFKPKSDNPIYLLSYVKGQEYDE